MIDRIKKLFARYAARHVVLALNVNRFNMDGVTIRSMRLENNLLKINGLADADQVDVELSGMRRVAVPQPDAAGQKNFSLVMPFALGVPKLMRHRGGHITEQELPQINLLQLWLKRFCLVPPFVVSLLQAAPAAIRWFRFKDPAARVEVRDLLGLAPFVEALQLDAGLFNKMETKPSEIGMDAPLVILMPIYNAFEVMQEALGRICANTDRPWHLILIEDCSSDPRVRPWLRDWVADHDQRPTYASGSIELIENEKNLGFIGGVNRGFERALTHLAEAPDDCGAAVILFNSDALVPKGWASRLTAPLAKDKSVASVTPLSNDAELMTVPVLCQRQPLKHGTADALDILAQQFATNGGALVNGDMPTGVGFCIALSLRYLRWEPRLDVAFGAGYGEEVDWCQKAIQRGGRHVACTNLFVEHRGGESFGSQKKQKLLLKNGEIITSRYPQFDQDVQDFIASDPLLTPRLALALGWAAQEGALKNQGPIHVYLAHTMGGGAEHDLERRIKRHIMRQGATVVVRVGGTLRWQIELHCATGVTRGATDDSEFLKRLISLLPDRLIVYSCGVGDQDPIGLPDMLLDLNGSHGVEILMHDFLPLSPSYTLLDRDGRFRGVPGPNTRDAAHFVRRPNGTTSTLADWRKAWSKLFEQCDRIEVFSENSKAIVCEAYPQSKPRIDVSPHELLHPVPRMSPGSTNKIVVGVLGNIGSHKGAGVLVKLSKQLRRAGIGLVVIGNVDPSYRLARTTKIHGDYNVEDISSLVARYGITCWLIPSIWPETFSFTTHEALATGLPVYAFDLGAQGAAVESSGQGAVAPLCDGAPDLNKLLELIKQKSHQASYE